MNILIWQLEIIRPADQEVLYQLFFLTEKRAMKWIKKNKEKFAKYNWNWRLGGESLWFGKTPDIFE